MTPLHEVDTRSLARRVRMTIMAQGRPGGKKLASIDVISVGRNWCLIGTDVEGGKWKAACERGEPEDTSEEWLLHQEGYHDWANPRTWKRYVPPKGMGKPVPLKKAPHVDQGVRPKKYRGRAGIQRWVSDRLELEKRKRTPVAAGIELERTPLLIEQLRRSKRAQDQTWSKIKERSPTVKAGRWLHRTARDAGVARTVGALAFAAAVPGGSAIALPYLAKAAEARRKKREAEKQPQKLAADELVRGPLLVEALPEFLRSVHVRPQTTRERLTKNRPTAMLGAQRRAQTPVAKFFRTLSAQFPHLKFRGGKVQFITPLERRRRSKRKKGKVASR